jgi:hypothetical protein
MPIDPGLDLEIVQHGVGPVVRSLADDLAVVVGEITEPDRRGRADLLAGRHHVAVLQLPAFVLGSDLGLADALQAEGALLHDAPGAHRDLGVVRHLGDAAFVTVKIEEVEPPDLVRAVVGAVPCADATVVHHDVQAFVVVGGGGHRTDLLTRRIFTMVAGYRLEPHFRIIRLA